MTQTKLIDTSTVTHEVTVTEADLKARLAQIVMHDFGLLDDQGKAPKGTEWQVLRGGGRKGGYRVRITRDLTRSDQPRLAGPEAGT